MNRVLLHCNKKIQTLGLGFYRGLLDTIDNCCVQITKLQKANAISLDQISINEDRITVFMLSRRAYCHMRV